MAFNLATSGCAMAHCDVRMSDRANASVATNISNVTLMDNQAGGSNIGLGVVSNGNIIVASYQDSPTLVKYDLNGNKIGSTTIFTSNALKSVPMLSTANEMIMADDQRIVRFNGNNPPLPPTIPATVFNVPHGRNSSPMSPVLTSNGYIVLGLENGEVITYQVDDQSNNPANVKVLALGSLIKNTPCVSGNSVFLSTNAGLKRVDISITGTPSLIWTQSGIPVVKAGGASPLFLNNFIYYDATLNGADYKIFKTNATSGAVDSMNLPAQLVASIAQSPINSTMYYYPVLRQVEHINENFDNLGNISLATLGGEASSVMTMASNNVMIIGTGIDLNAAVTAIDLNNNTRLWRVGVGQLNTFGQFAIVNNKVFCTTRTKRLYKLS